MVEIILTALTEAGEKALRSYHDEKLTWADRIKMRASKLRTDKKFVSQSPLVHVSSMSFSTSRDPPAGKFFDILRRELVSLYEKKLLDYGATREDVAIKVQHG